MMKMTKQEILALAKKTKDFYEYMGLVDNKVQICGYGEGYKPQIHIYKSSDIDKIGKKMKMEVKINPEMEHKELIIGGVLFFSLWEGEK